MNKNQYKLNDHLQNPQLNELIDKFKGDKDITYEEQKSKNPKLPHEEVNLSKLAKKCFHCKKKLKLINFTCRCGHKYCIKHQNSHSHNCSYDLKKSRAEEIKLNNPKINLKHQKI